jgi:hypothetical protein
MLAIYDYRSAIPKRLTDDDPLFEVVALARAVVLADEGGLLASLAKISLPPGSATALRQQRLIEVTAYLASDATFPTTRYRTEQAPPVGVAPLYGHTPYATTTPALPPLQRRYDFFINRGLAVQLLAAISDNDKSRIALFTSLVLLVVWHELAHIMVAVFMPLRRPPLAYRGTPDIVQSVHTDEGGMCARQIPSLSAAPTADSVSYRGHCGYEVETDILLGTLGVRWASQFSTADFSSIKGLVVHVSPDDYVALRERVPLPDPGSSIDNLPVESDISNLAEGALTSFKANLGARLTSLADTLAASSNPTSGDDQSDVGYIARGSLLGTGSCDAIDALIEEHDLAHAFASSDLVDDSQPSRAPPMQTWIPSTPSRRVGRVVSGASASSVEDDHVPQHEFIDGKAKRTTVVDLGEGYGEQEVWLTPAIEVDGVPALR